MTARRLLGVESGRGPAPRTSAPIFATRQIATHGNWSTYASSGEGARSFLLTFNSTQWKYISLPSLRSLLASAPLSDESATFMCIFFN